MIERSNDTLPTMFHIPLPRGTAPRPCLRTRFLAAVFGTLALVGATAAQAEWPERSIRVIVPFPPGGPSDIVLRTAADKLQASLKQAVILDNRPGAGGNLGASEAARAAPDGYTWFWTTDSVLTVNPHVYAHLGFKPEDLMPVMIASQFAQTLVCNPGVGVKTVPELVAKAKKESMNYASGGAGVPGHLAMELMLSSAGVQMQHIPYKGPAPATQDVVGGQVPCGFLAGPTVLPLVRAGKLVALAVSGSQRSPTLPDVPTVAETYPGYDATFMLVLMAPRGTPAPVVAAMHKAMADALHSSDLVDKLKLTDQEVVADTPAQAAAVLAATSAKWGGVAKKINLKLD